MYEKYQKWERTCYYISYKLLKENKRIKRDQIYTQSTKQSELFKSVLKNDSIIKNLELENQ